MQTEMIQVQNTKAPQPGSKYTNYSVFGANDEFFIIAPQFVDRLKVGETYQLAWEQVGKARKIIGINGNALQDGPAPIGAAVAHLDPVQQAKAQLAKAEAEAAERARAANAVHHEADMTSAHIFVTGVVQRSAQAGLQPAQWEEAAMAAARAYMAACAVLEGRDKPNPPVETGPGVGPMPPDNYPDDFVQ